MKNELLNNLEKEMNTVITAWTDHLAKIRTGRANANMLSSVYVDFYGTPTPIVQTSQISTPEPQQILIKPYDKGQISSVVAGINKSNLGLNPISEGDVIRIQIPALTEDIRKDLVKKMLKEQEGFRVRVRNLRRDTNNSIKNNKEISEDMVKDIENEIQKLTDTYIKKIDDLAKNKEQDLMKI